MGLSSKLCLGLLLVVTWAFGGGFSWGPYLVGAGGLVCLASALIELRWRKIWSWRILPWLLWIALVGISLLNPSHLPEDPTLTTPGGKVVFDTLGHVNPAVPVEHEERWPTTSSRTRTGLYLFTTVGIMAFSMAVVLIPWTRREVRRWLTILFGSAMLLTLAGYWFFFKDPKLIYGMFQPEGHNPFAGFHYKNCWAAYALLSASVGIGMAAYFSKARKNVIGARNPTAFFVFACPLILLSLPLLQSRAGLLLVVLLLSWLLALLVVNWVRAKRSSGGASVVPMMALALGLLGLGWYSWQTMAPHFEAMWSKSERQVEGVVNADEPTGRMVLIRDTIVMAREKPWYGWGLATFSQVYPKYQSFSLYYKQHFPGGRFSWVPRRYEFAHCDWLQYWAETGAVGLFLLVATPFLWFVHYCRRGRFNPLSHWLGVGCVLILFLATFEFPFGCEAVALLFATCFGLSGKYAILEKQRLSRGKGKGRRRRREKRSQRADDELSGLAEGGV